MAGKVKSANYLVVIQFHCQSKKTQRKVVSIGVVRPTDIRQILIFLAFVEIYELFSINKQFTARRRPQRKNEIPRLISYQLIHKIYIAFVALRYPKFLEFLFCSLPRIKVFLLRYFTCHSSIYIAFTASRCKKSWISILAIAQNKGISNKMCHPFMRSL